MPRKQKLLTKAILEKLPPLGATEKLEETEKKVVVKFFNPTGVGTWYALEFDPEERRFFGYAKITDGEFGYFSLDELESFQGRLGLGIERDIHWDPNTSMADVLNGKAT